MKEIPVEEFTKRIDGTLEFVFRTGVRVKAVPKNGYHAPVIIGFLKARIAELIKQLEEKYEL